MKKEYVKPRLEQVSLAASGDVLQAVLNSSIKQGQGETLAPKHRGF